MDDHVDVAMIGAGDVDDGGQVLLGRVVAQLDTFGTYAITAAGPFDESKQAVVMYGEDVDPLLGTQKYDIIVRILGPDKYMMEIVFNDKEHTRGAAEFKEVEVTYTRVQ